MILYKGTALEFREATDTNKMVDLIDEAFRNKLGRKVPVREKSAFTNSLSSMEKIIRRSKVSDDCGVLVEYMIPNTSRRVDFLIAGKDKESNKNFVLVELKQWDQAEKTNIDSIVKTFLGGGLTETNHPSYQASSYKLLLEDFNESISKGNIIANACAYLHNYPEKNPEPLKDEIYKEHVNEAQLFLKDDTEKLENFIKNYVGEGEGMKILYEIENGKIKPSKKLIDHVSEMLEGNQEFTLIDEQKVSFEVAKNIATTATDKSVVIIKGGPGTGKSVISVNLLGSLLKEEQNVAFVAPNAAFRTVVTEKLSKNMTKKRVRHLFKGSSGFVDVEKDIYDTLVIDEAHRLKNRKAFMYQGENQIEDVINSSKTSIFFIDDNQIVRPEDVGSVQEIKKIAKEHNAHIKELELSAQFRCSGAEGYVNWLDNVLQIRETANFDGWDKEDFEFKIFSDPNELKEAIYKKDQKGFDARLLAGYAWQWTGAKKGNPNAEINDVEIPKHNFSMPWNSRKNRTKWAIMKEGREQVGCIHTVQGLEFDYVGVIVGDDLKFDPENYEYYTEWSNYKDSKGKQELKDKPKKLNKLVRNVYKTLLSRPHRGCYVYFVDKNVEEHFRKLMSAEQEERKTVSDVIDNTEKATIPIPLVGMAPCGDPILSEQNIEEYIEVDKNKIKSGYKYFILRAKGDSMNLAGINEGDLVLCRNQQKADTGDKVVALLDGEVTIKFYDKKDGYRILLPKSSNKKHKPIKPDEGDSVQGIAQEILKSED